jgi:hypothetical protein
VNECGGNLTRKEIQPEPKSQSAGIDEIRLRMIKVRDGDERVGMEVKNGARDLNKPCLQSD